MRLATALVTGSTMALEMWLATVLAAGSAAVLAPVFATVSATGSEMGSATTFATLLDKDPAAALVAWSAVVSEMGLSTVLVTESTAS